MDFDVGYSLAILKAIIELTYSLQGSGFVHNKPCGGKKFEDNVMAFYKKDN